MAKIVNTLPSDGSYIDRTSQLINDGEFGTSRFVEEFELEDLVGEIIKVELNNQVFNFSQQDEVICEHLLGRIPNVKIMIGTMEVIAPIEHLPNNNVTIVRFNELCTGKIEIN